MDCWENYIMSAGNLDELCERLNECAEAHRDTEECRIPESIDLTSLPTFGPEMADTVGIYSWDATRQLVPVSQGPFVPSQWSIKPRNNQRKENMLDTERLTVSSIHCDES